MIGMKKIFSYKEYLKLQKRKTEDPMRRSKWIDKIEENTQKFKPTFQQYMGTIGAHKNQTSYCLGARTGEEVLALRELGFTQAMGTDLVPHEDYVIECDIHNMIFEDNSVSFYYTNIFDHSINPVKFLSEIQRSSKNIIGYHQSRAEYFILLGQNQRALNQLEYALKLTQNNFQVSETIMTKIIDIKKELNRSRGL